MSLVHGDACFVQHVTTCDNNDMTIHQSSFSNLPAP